MVDDTGENAIVVASGANLDTRAEQLSDALLPSGGMLVLQMEIPHPENWAAIERARSRKVRTILVSPQRRPSHPDLDQVDFILVNELEGRAILKRLASKTSPRRITESGPTWGDLHSHSRRRRRHCRGTKPGMENFGIIGHNLVDTTGAGDAFAGCLAAGYRVPSSAPLRFAVTGAGLSCSGLGAQPSCGSSGDTGRNDIAALARCSYCSESLRLIRHHSRISQMAYDQTSKSDL